MSSNNSSVPLPTIQAWLSSLLPSVPDWEVTPETTALLSSLYNTNINVEKDSVREIELLEQARLEYVGETERCKGVLGAVGQGVEESLSQGPAQAYCEVLTNICSSLELDSSNIVGIEKAVSDLLTRQAECGPVLGKVKDEVDRMRGDAVGLYEKLSRLGEVVEKAAKEEREDASTALTQSRKLEYIRAKGNEYKKSVERAESVLTRNGANDNTVRHEEIVKLNNMLTNIEVETDPLSRQLQGFLSLPPSRELAKVELAKSREVLEILEKEVADQISSLHV